MNSKQFGEMHFKTGEERKRYAEFILNPDRLDHYSRILERYWNDTSIPRVRQHRMSYDSVASFLDDVSPGIAGKSVLEVGPNGLVFHKYLNDAGATVTIFDGSLSHYCPAGTNVEGIEGDLRNIETLLGDRQFDVILSADVFSLGSSEYALTGIKPLDAAETVATIQSLSGRIKTGGFYIDSRSEDAGLIYGMLETDPEFIMATPAKAADGKGKSLVIANKSL